MLAYVILGSAMIILDKYVSNQKLCGLLQAIAGILIFAAVFGRLLSGVHWLTDIIGGMLLSAALLCWFAFALEMIRDRRRQMDY